MSKLMFRMFGETKIVYWVWGVGTVLAIAFWGSIGYVAWHFISKLWQCMSDREIALWRLALHWRKEWDDACPDVGMGPSMETLLDELERQAGIHLTEKDRKVILNG